MRYTATICVDIWADSMEDAERKSLDIVLGLPNSYQIELFKKPHGSDISLIKENQPKSDSLISKSEGQDE